MAWDDRVFGYCLEAISRYDCFNEIGDFRALMISRGFELARASMNGAACLLGTDLPTRGFLACTLLRPYYEVGIRLLWASLELEGFIRLQTYYAQEDMKFAREVRTVPGFAGVVEEVSETRGDCENGTMPPPLPVMIEKIVSEADGLRRDTFYSLYRMLSRPSHGHLGAVGSISRDLGHVPDATCRAATYFLCSAVCVMASETPEISAERRQAVLQELYPEVELLGRNEMC